MFDAVGGRRDPEALVRHVLAGVALIAMSSCTGVLGLFGWVAWQLLKLLWALLVRLLAPPEEVQFVTLVEPPEVVALSAWEEHREPPRPPEIPLPVWPPEVRRRAEDSPIVHLENRLFAILGTMGGSGDGAVDVLVGDGDLGGLGLIGTGLGGGGLGTGIIRWREPAALIDGAPVAGQCRVRVEVNAAGKGRFVAFEACDEDVQDSVRGEVARALWAPAKEGADAVTAEVVVAWPRL